MLRSDNIDEVIEFSIEDSGNMNWMPEEPVTVTYNVVLTEQPEGNYVFYIQLFDEKSGEVVDIGLPENLKR
jgi:hypothetical protein